MSSITVADGYTLEFKKIEGEDTVVLTEDGASVYYYHSDDAVLYRFLVALHEEHNE